jgi:IclR family pca regulon transcriptional regulator
LLTLAHLGYLDTDGSYFWLSAKVLRFSGSYLASARLPSAVAADAQPPCGPDWATRCRPWCWTATEVVIVARSGSNAVLAYGLHLGARLPAHATSTGRVLLAAKTRSDLNAWMKGLARIRDVLARLTPLHGDRAAGVSRHHRPGTYR